MKNIVSIYTLILLLLVSACKKDQDIPADTPRPVETVSVRGQWLKGYYKGELITYERKNNMNLFLGDIIIQNSEISLKPQKPGDEIRGTGVSGTDYLWPKRTLTYIIDPNTPPIKKRWILTAINRWAVSTGFKFKDVSKNSSKGDYVYFGYGENGNNSYVGRIGGLQMLNLQSDGVGVIVHELGHALGMYHEQTRSDRDDYIKINWDNISELWKPQYLKYACADNLLADAPGTRFDYNSIMLYPAMSGDAIDPSVPVMTKMNGEIWGDNIYNGTHAPSATDANWVKVRYKLH